MPSQSPNLQEFVDVELIPLERLEFQDATRYFLASHLTKATSIELPPLETSCAQRDIIFATFKGKNKLQIHADATPANLKSHTFWRRVSSEKGATLPPEVKVLAVENKKSCLQRLPTELLEIIEMSMSFRDKVALRLTSRALFIRLQAPATKDNVPISDLDDLRWSWKLRMLVEREQRGPMTFYRTEEGNTVQVPMLVCSFCCSFHHQHYFSSKQIQICPKSRVCIGAERKVTSSYGNLYNMHQLQLGSHLSHEANDFTYDKKDLSNSLNGGQLTLYIQPQSLTWNPDHTMPPDFHENRPFQENVPLFTYERYKVELLKLANNSPRYRGRNLNGTAVSMYNPVRVLQEKKDKMCHCIANVLTRKKIRELQESVQTFASYEPRFWHKLLDHPFCPYKCRVYCATRQHPYTGAGGWGSRAKLIEVIYRTSIPPRVALHPAWMLAIGDQSIIEKDGKIFIPRDEEKV
jgi:hypothetical protein